MHKKLILIVIVILMLATGGFVFYASENVLEFEELPQRQTIALKLEDGSQFLVTIENYTSQDPFRYAKYLIVSPTGDKVYLFFETTESGEENKYIAKAAAIIGEIVGRNKKNIYPRPLDRVRKAMIYVGLIGTKSKPMVYLKTPNLGGRENKLIVADGKIILEAKSFEDIVILANFLRTLVIS